jgi:hypothetical protein
MLLLRVGLVNADYVEERMPVVMTVYNIRRIKPSHWSSAMLLIGRNRVLAFILTEFVIIIPRGFNVSLKVSDIPVGSIISNLQNSELSKSFFLRCETCNYLFNECDNFIQDSVNLLFRFASVSKER